MIALDLATRSGWAVADPGGVTASGVVGLSDRPRGEAAIQRHARMGDVLALVLADLLDEHRPDVACVETAAGAMKGEAARVLFGLRMVAGVVLWRRELLIDEAPASQWQPWARAHADWTKGDEEDARGIALWWQAVRMPLVREVRA